MITLKAKKDLNYWKKKLLSVLKGDAIEKSLEDILFPGMMIKSLSEDVQDMLQKARGFAPGTIRTWQGKDYKKLSSGKWMRTYTGTGERGERQAVRNVMRAIQGANSIEELAEIVNKNMQRFKDESGKTLPIVKEFMVAARGSKSGEKDIKRDDINKKVKDFKARLLKEKGEPGTITNKLEDGFKPHRIENINGKKGWEYSLKNHLGKKIEITKTQHDYARALLESGKYERAVVRGKKIVVNKEKPETSKEKLKTQIKTAEKELGKKWSKMSDKEQDKYVDLLGDDTSGSKFSIEKTKDKPGNEVWTVTEGKDKYRVNKTKNGWRVSDAKTDFSIVGLKFADSPEETIKIFKEGKEKKDKQPDKPIDTNKKTGKKELLTTSNVSWLESGYGKHREGVSILDNLKKRNVLQSMIIEDKSTPSGTKYSSSYQDWLLNEASDSEKIEAREAIETEVAAALKNTENLKRFLKKYNVSLIDSKYSSQGRVFTTSKWAINNAKKVYSLDDFTFEKSLKSTLALTKSIIIVRKK